MPEANDPDRRPVDEAWPALRYFDGPLSVARREAERELRKSPPCTCCATPIAHVFDRIGSTLFFDDDPRELSLNFDPDEREVFTPRLLAACILLRGRRRVQPRRP